MLALQNICNKKMHWTNMCVGRTDAELLINHLVISTKQFTH